MEMLKSVFLFPLFIIFVAKNVESTQVDHCVLGNGTLPPEVILENCDIQPCVFYSNATSTMTMRFKSPRYLEHFAPSAVALAMGLVISYPLGEDDACVGVTNTPCPLAEEEYIEYSYSMFILPIFPKITFTLEFSLNDKDRNNEQFECFRVDIDLQELS